MPSAVIIGAGPAGSLAATMLARAGWSIELIEQQMFPRDKVCGECMSALGLAVLDRAGLLQRLRVHGLVPLRRAMVWSTFGDSIGLPLPDEMGGLSRAVLDTQLRDAAADAGASVLQPARCEAIIPGRAPVVRVRDPKKNRTFELQPDVVIVADGKGGVTAGIIRSRNGDLGVKCHLTGVDGPPDMIELFGLVGHYVGLAAIEGDCWNLAMSVPKRLVRGYGGDFDRLLQSATTQNPALAKRLKSAVRVSVWHSSPLPRFPVAADWPAGVVLIGNAAAALEPIGGEGMGLALRSAELAANKLIIARTAHGEAGDLPADIALQLQKDYRRLWKHRSRWCRLIATITSHPLMSTAVMECGLADGRLTVWTAGRMGKMSAGVNP